jgi:metal-dependent amidase/aminoacylase/carboxypeptidase family protein
MNEEWRCKAHGIIKSHSEQLTASMGGSVDIDIRVGYPFLENNPELTEKAKAKAIRVLGQENVVDLPIRLTAEDFSYFSQKTKATFIRIGVKNEAKNIVHPVHNPKFDIDEESMRIGIQTLLAQVFLD